MYKLNIIYYFYKKLLVFFFFWDKLKLDNIDNYKQVKLFLTKIMKKFENDIFVKLLHDEKN